MRQKDTQIEYNYFAEPNIPPILLEDDFKEQLNLIISFFDSGIYCNRYHYLWFLKRLKILSDKIPVSEDVIKSCLKNFKFWKLDIYRYFIGRPDQSMNLQNFVKNRKNHEKVMRFVIE